MKGKRDKANEKHVGNEIYKEKKRKYQPHQYNIKRKQ
jgi:hypothetical protein